MILSLSLSLIAFSLRALRKKKTKKKRKEERFSGKERIVVERTKNNEHKRRSLSLSFSLFLSPSRGGLNKTTKE
jgi:hypothetical protein